MTQGKQWPLGPPFPAPTFLFVRGIAAHAALAEDLTQFIHAIPRDLTNGMRSMRIQVFLGILLQHEQIEQAAAVLRRVPEPVPFHKVAFAGRWYHHGRMRCSWGIASFAVAFHSSSTLSVRLGSVQRYTCFVDGREMKLQGSELRITGLTREANLRVAKLS